MLLKIFFTGFVIFCVWMLSTKMRSKARDAKQSPRVKTVKCAVCGVYLPAKDAELGTDNEYRCKEHQGR